MNYQGLQVGIHKAKKRVPKRWVNSDQENYERCLKFARKTTKRCSCIGCGNQRRISGLTRQERQWEERSVQELTDGYYP